MRYATPGGFIPRSARSASISASPCSLQAADTPGVAPVEVSGSSPSPARFRHAKFDGLDGLPLALPAISLAGTPGAPDTAGGAPAVPMSMTLKASAQFVGPDSASAPSAGISPHASAHLPQPTHTSQRVPLHLGAPSSEASDALASSSKHRPHITQTAHRVPLRWVSSALSLLAIAHLLWVVDEQDHAR